ncbi:MAG TPA: hypothetical protein VGR65_03900 [Casimicrobiaceae bacterium]|jgi:hypothetical protein|nr:hypothetical protein [Casimicrobiaceae bacterium]
MKAFAEKLLPVEQEISQEKGPFLLFALFLREDAADLWDVLVSAPWIDANQGDALRFIVPKVQAVATPDELAKLSRVAIIETNHPALRAFQSAIHIEHGLAEVQNSSFSGLQIRHAYIITSRPLAAHERRPLGAG